MPPQNRFDRVIAEVRKNIRGTGKRAQARKAPKFGTTVPLREQRKSDPVQQMLKTMGIRPGDFNDLRGPRAEGEGNILPAPTGEDIENLRVNRQVDLNSRELRRLIKKQQEFLNSLPPTQIPTDQLELRARLKAGTISDEEAFRASINSRFFDSPVVEFNRLKGEPRF